MRLTSLTVASGPAASSAVIVSILRRPSRPPAALISSAASVWPLREGRPRIAPGPDWIVMWPNFTGVSGTRPLAVSCASATPATASWPAIPSDPPSPTAPPMLTPRPARNSRRSSSLPMSFLHDHVDGMDAIAPRTRLHAPALVGGAGMHRVAAGRRVPRARERLPLVIVPTRRDARRSPRGPAVGTHVHRAHGPVAPRPATDRLRAGGQRRAVGRRHDDGVDVELAHRTQPTVDAP